MRLLKASVIVMGVLIVIGTVVLVVGIINQSNKVGRAGGTAAARDFGETTDLPLGLPDGATLDQVTTGTGGVVLKVTVPGEGPAVYVVPWRGGRVLRITLGKGRAATGGAPAKGAPAKP